MKSATAKETIVKAIATSTYPRLAVIVAVAVPLAVACGLVHGG